MSRWKPSSSRSSAQGKQRARADLAAATRAVEVAAGEAAALDRARTVLAEAEAAASSAEEAEEAARQQVEELRAS